MATPTTPQDTLHHHTALLGQLGAERVQLRHCATRVTTQDGRVAIVDREVVAVQPPTTGFVVDTSPDSVAALVAPGVFLGSQDCVTDDAYLHSLGIKHILCVAPMIAPLFPDQFDYKTIPILDLPTFDIAAPLAEALAFITTCVKRDEPVLVHCNAGVSRSATVAVAHVMSRFSLGYDAALSRVRAVRPCVRPNAGFALYLRSRFVAN